MAQYIIDLDSRTYGFIADIMTYRVNEMKKYGLDVYLSDEKPDDSFKEDKYLVVHLNWQLGLIRLLEFVDEKKKEILSSKAQGIVLYQDIQSGDFFLQQTDITDKSLLTKTNEGKFVRHIFTLPDKDIINTIKAHIKSMYGES